ncbi:hypothetical protein BD410DRAFT_195812 [Rickenella mellea]|uniref:Uncharacterized protein n=1 Tax=Rickenella mellea TaxID=50990 RepID=A0A4Y7Q605_9AGAM|nr:hypothetical protein BD410DRAFT_195812 [Rickenella mellea]
MYPVLLKPSSIPDMLKSLYCDSKIIIGQSSEVLPIPGDSSHNLFPFDRLFQFSTLFQTNKYTTMNHLFCRGHWEYHKACRSGNLFIMKGGARCGVEITWDLSNKSFPLLSKFKTVSFLTMGELRRHQVRFW